MTDKPSLRLRWRERRQRWSEYRPSKVQYFWSCAICILATIVVGFAWGGWVTARQADRMASAAARQARAEVVAGYCVARFESAPDVATQLVALKKTAPWSQDDFISDGGWVTPPGSTQPVTDAADLCAQRLLAAKVPMGKAAASPAAKSRGSSG